MKSKDEWLDFYSKPKEKGWVLVDEDKQKWFHLKSKTKGWIVNGREVAFQHIPSGRVIQARLQEAMRDYQNLLDALKKGDDEV